jgi:4-amino-4-deoxy-L-arabinose transferase-like glycosyltransferase
MTTSDYPALRLEPPRRARLRAAVAVGPVPVEVWVLGALIALAAVIRIMTIDNQSFWTDEALTAYETSVPFGAMLNTVAHVETTPPLYFVLIWGWGKAFGTGEVALRSVSTLAGIALVPLAYFSARELVSRRAGAIAAAFVAVNPFLIWYSQEARAYMLLAALTGGSFLCFIRARREPSARNLAWWTVFSALAVMTHFFAGFAIAPEALWLLWIWRTRAVAIAVALVAVAQAAMVPFALIDTSHGPGWISAIPPIHRIEQLALEWGVDLLTRRIGLVYGLIGGTIVLAAIAALLLAGGDRQIRHGAGVAAVIAACVFVIPLALGVVGQDYFYVRNEIPAFVPLATVIAAACVMPRGRVLGATLALALLALFSYSTFTIQTTTNLQRPDWASVARVLGPAPVPRAILAASGSNANPLKIYLPGVSWAQPHARRVLIAEVDVVGVRRKLPVVSPGQNPNASASSGGPSRREAPVPTSVAPPGTRLEGRFRVHNWVIAQFALRHPQRLSIRQLNRSAHGFFRRTPAALLIFMQRPQR